MFGTVLILLSLLLGAVARPSPALLGTTLLLSRQDDGKTGIGHITAVANLHATRWCQYTSCELKVLGLSQSEIDDKIRELKDVSTAATPDDSGCGRLAAGGGMLGSVLLGLTLVVL
ncbi:hypothetical protein B0H14DRAFT_2570095 [Mycena olivaceomarginata]|nr:hypothetical protein B0H14DRAFT_2570095 [Mycena olivaceomarginata]